MKPINAALVGKAVARFCEIHDNMTFNEGSQEGHARWLLTSKPADGPAEEIVLRLVDGRIACENEHVKSRITEIIAMGEVGEQAKEPVATPDRYKSQGPRPNRAKPAALAGSVSEQKTSVVQDWQGKQARTYSVEGSSGVPNAFAVSEEANRRGFNIETDSGRTAEIAWGKARAINPTTGQFREAKVTFEWTAFRQKTAWEIVRGMEKREPGILQGVDDVTMLPILAPVPYKGQPASLYLHLQILNRWTFADRDAESKAERRAVLKLANREWREDDEVDSERAEEEAVRGLKA